MTTHPYLHHGLSILTAQLKPSNHPLAYGTDAVLRPFLTLSRETCAGATSLGQHLLPLLDENLGEEERSWMFLDKDLINRALSMHHLPERLAEYLPEDRLSEVKGLIGEMVGLHPPIWELEHQVAEAIHKLAKLGCVILSGRAANLITRDLPGGLHVRLVASFESRITRAQQINECSRGEAEAFIRENDSARQRFVQTNFSTDINDPHTYDLVINTDRISSASAAHLVLRALQERIAALAPAG
jgi:cytidylate kinase